MATLAIISTLLIVASVKCNEWAIDSRASGSVIVGVGFTKNLDSEMVVAVGVSGRGNVRTK
jgi:hypothetical protein